MSNVLPRRAEAIARQVQPICAQLDSIEEVQLCVSMLQARGKELRRHATTALETLSRQFLQQRHLLFGNVPGPWTVEFAKPLSVWHQRSGFDFAVHKTYTDKWHAEISRAKFVKLGRSALARYAELQVDAELLLPPEDMERYGVKPGEKLLAYCRLSSLITAGPKWVVDPIARARLSRARALAEQALRKQTAIESNKQGEEP